MICDTGCILPGHCIARPCTQAWAAHVLVVDAARLQHGRLAVNEEYDMLLGGHPFLHTHKQACSDQL